MRIDEGKGRIARQRNALAWRRDAWRALIAGRGPFAFGKPKHRVEIDMRADKARSFSNQLVELRELFRLQQPEMPFRQRDRRMPWQRAEHGDADTCHRFAHEIFVTRASDAVEHHTGDPHALAEIAQA